MRVFLFVPLFLMWGIVAGVTQPVPERQVALPAEAGLVVGHQARDGRAVLVELVPKGETVEDFTKMVSLQTAPNLGTVPEAAFLEQFGEKYSAACPNTAATDVPFGAGGARGLRLDCPRHPATGTMETVFVRVLDLGQDLGIVQITLRTFPMPADAQWARDYLGRVTVQ